MASIKSSLVLQDGMTKVLNHINKAMGLTLNSFEAIQKASGKSFNTANIAAMRNELGAANASMNEMEQSYRDCEGGQKNLNKRINEGQNATDGLLNKVKGIASTYLGMKAAKGSFELSDTITQTNARLNMMNDGLQTTDELNDMIYASAQRSRGSYLETADAVSKLGLMAGDAFSDNKETIAFMEQVNKQFKIAGTEASGIDAAMLQLTQAMGSGVLRGEEYNSILEQAPNIIQSIADYMNVPKGKLKDMAAEGKITADIVKSAMFAASDETNAKFESMPKTWSDIWTSIKNRAIKALNPVLTKINQLANSERVQKTVDGLINAFSIISVVLTSAFDKVCAVYDFVVDNWDFMGPIIGGIAAAFLLYSVASFIATTAQWLLNSAILSCPITWIIIAIIALVVVFVLFTEQVMGAIFWLGALFKNIGLWIANCGIATWQVIKNVGLWFANLGLAIWQVIKNIGTWFANLGSAAWAIIKNTGLWFANLGMGIWNVLKACAGNVGTAFHNAWVYIQIGFWSMLDVIMQGLKSLAEKANKYLGWMGVDIDTSGLDLASKKIDELKDKKESYTSVSDAWADGFSTFEYDNVNDAWNSHEYGSVSDAYGTFEYGSIGDAFNTFDAFEEGWGSEAYNSGAELGAGIKGWINDNLSISGIMQKLGLEPESDNSDSWDPVGYGGVLDDISESTDETAQNTGKNTEELSYLRDIAEREAINRFTTAEVKIDMTGMTNRIDSSMDLDGVLTTLTEGFAEALEISAEGVHV